MGGGGRDRSRNKSNIEVLIFQNMKNSRVPILENLNLQLMNINLTRCNIDVTYFVRVIL